jgi:hypothetical protein
METTVPATSVTLDDSNHHGHAWRGQTDQQRFADGFTAVALGQSKIDDGISVLSTSVVAYAKDAAATAYQIEGRQGLALAERTNAISVEATKNFYALNVQADKNFAEVKLQMSECCCELKELIMAQSVATQNLVSSLDREQRLRETVQLQAEIFYLKGRIPAGTPV